MRKLKVTELNRITTEQFKEVDKLPLIIVLDDIRSLYNVGSIFRTSDAFRVRCIYLCGITAVPPSAEIHKTALGAEFSVEWKYFNNTLDAIKELKESNYEVYAIEQVENSIKFNDFIPDIDKKYALVLGNEVKGVKQEVVDICDGSLELPQYGTKHSLNVSVTGGIVIWEMFVRMHPDFVKKK